MLQQTQTDRVVPCYARFLDRFSRVDTLAAAPLKDVLQLWQGLGYNRRARYLHETARRIVETFGGRVPEDPSTLEALPGIGPGTAGAVAAFAFRRPVVFIETNIRRVFIHLFFSGAESVSDREILPLVEATLDRDNPREWYYGLMDYGVHLASLFSNPNRRSRHYTRQSPFENSNRQVRGRIVRALTRVESAPLEALAAECGSEGPMLEKAIDGLIAEGMIVRETDTGRYRIPS